ncbi:MAG: DNA polymerase/3'-5' exonuclease PolX [Patescibacteria group bacterium]
MKATNREIAKILYEISEILEIQNIPFKPRAYQKAAMTVDSLDRELSEIFIEGGIKAINELPAIGASIAMKIVELLKTGKLKYFDKIKKNYPLNLTELTSIEGLGPKMAARLFKELDIRNLEDLEKAAKAKKIRKLPDFGEKSEQNILRGIEFLKSSGDRMLLSDVLPVAERIVSHLEKIKGVKKVIYAGSLRRMQETIGDIDILAISDDPKLIMEAFTDLAEVKEVYSRGKTRSSVRLLIGCDADLRVVPEKSFGAALQYFTGNKDHNVEMRKIAISKGYKLNEYGLFRGKKTIVSETEKEIYEKLSMDTPPPEIRNASGEIAAARFDSVKSRRAQKRALPKLIGYSDIQGDLQIQTSWTDGADSIEENAKAAQNMGYKYIAITDHTKSLAMTGGLDEKKIAEQGKEIDRLNKKFRGFKILKSAEVNIMKDGSLDIENSTLKKLDIVSAAVHSNFNMTRPEMTMRIIKAMKNPYLNILFHPTGRIINRRKGYDLDIDAIIAAAKKYGVALEIDAYPNRLDLKDEYIRKAVEAGVKLVIDTDAHDKSHLHFIKYGIAQARRGWAKKSDILNTKSADELLKALKKLKKPAH